MDSRRRAKCPRGTLAPVTAIRGSSANPDRGSSVKAIYFDQYGPPEVLSLRDLPTPAPQPGEVLIKVQASSVNAADWHIMRADPFLARLMFGLFKP